MTNVNINAQAKDVFFNFTYVPVYVNNFTYKGKTYKTYISGTTGKVVGETPKSIAAVAKKFVKFIGVAAIIAAIGYLFLRK